MTQPNFHRKTTERTVEKGGDRKGSPLEGESGLTPAGKTLPNSSPQRGLRRREGTRIEYFEAEKVNRPAVLELYVYVVSSEEMIASQQSVMVYMEDRSSLPNYSKIDTKPCSSPRWFSG